MNTLYLASQSKSRQRLLKDSGLAFKIASQNADEKAFDHNLPLQDLVTAIAISKMDHVVLPAGTENEICYVIAADTLGKNYLGQTCTKPKDKNEAIEMLKSYRKGAKTGTGFCIDRKIWRKPGHFDELRINSASGEEGLSSAWQIDKRIVGFASAEYIFDISDDEFERYFDLSLKAGVHYLNVSGGVAIEEFGDQYLKSINGSYTAVVGLPMYEIRVALKDLGFFTN